MVLFGMGETNRDKPNSSPSRILIPLVLIALIVGLLSKLNVALNLPLQSDSSEPALLFYDLVENGNIFLSNWYLVHNCYLLTDFPLYVLLGLSVGMSAITVKIGAFIIFIANCLLVFMLVKRAVNARAASVAVLIMLGSGVVASKTVMQPFSHIGTLTFALLSLLIFSHLIQTRKSRRMPVVSTAAILFVCAFAAVFSDLYFIIAFPIPLLLTYTLSMLVYRDRMLPPKAEILVALSLVAGMMLGKSFHTIALEVFNLHLEQTSVSMSLIPLSTLGDNIVFYFESMAELFGITYRSSDFSTARILLGTINASLLVISLVVAFKISFQKQDRQKRFLVLYVLAMICAVSIAYILFQKEYSLGLVRYLNPLPLSYAVLIGVFISEYSANFKRGMYRILVISALCISFLHGTVAGLQYKEDSPHRAIAEHLETSGLEYGYARFWDANVLTVLTKNTVKVRPVVFNPSSAALQRQLWVSNSTWYDPDIHKGSTFILLRDGTEQDLKVLSGLFGDPDRVDRIEGVVIYVWSYNIFSKIPAVKYREAS